MRTDRGRSRAADEEVASEVLLPVDVSRFDGRARPGGSLFAEMSRSGQPDGLGEGEGEADGEGDAETDGEGEPDGCAPRRLAISCCACSVAAWAAAISRWYVARLPARRAASAAVKCWVAWSRSAWICSSTEPCGGWPPPSGGTTSPSESVSAARSDEPIPIAEPFATTTRLSSGIAFS